MFVNNDDTYPERLYCNRDSARSFEEIYAAEIEEELAVTSNPATLGELLEEELRLKGAAQKENLENKMKRGNGMARIELTFWKDGSGSLGTNKTLQEDLDENYGADPPPVCHLTIEARPDTYDEEAMNAMVGMAWIEIAANESFDCLLEKIVTKVFQAGMEYARSLQK